MREASVKKSSISNELYEALEYGEELILRENNEIDEMANVRGERQKTVLLEQVCRLKINVRHAFYCFVQKLVGEADQRWRLELLSKIDRSVTGLVRSVVYSSIIGRHWLF